MACTYDYGGMLFIGVLYHLEIEENPTIILALMSMSQSGALKVAE
jgi:hypothetical protein